MKRFYKSAEAGTAPGGFVVRLDGKPIKTVMQHHLILQSQPLAEAIANEWQTQGADIVPSSMPLMQLATTMADKVKGADRAAMNVEILKYGASDLVCYFAATPPDLVKRQEQHWLPLLQWLEREHGARLEHISGIQYHNQPQDSLETLNKIITGLSSEDFTVVQSATAVCGSLVIALALMDGYLDAAGAYEAACVDEIYQLEKWGEDNLARKRLDHIKSELEAIVRFRDLVRA
jgi:chaperone required for assembly of F1-ATPase